MGLDRNASNVVEQNQSLVVNPQTLLRTRKNSLTHYAESTMDNHVQKAQEYIEKNFALIKRIDSVADALGLNYERLRKAFVRKMGISMQQYIEEVRVSKARWKISEGKKLYAVAREVGYAHETTLIKHFKRITGMTPKQYYELFKDDEEEEI